MAQANQESSKESPVAGFRIARVLGDLAVLAIILVLRKIAMISIMRIVEPIREPGGHSSTWDDLR